MGQNGQNWGSRPNGMQNYFTLTPRASSNPTRCIALKAIASAMKEAGGLGAREGGGHCLYEGRYPKQNYRPPVLCYHSPLSLPLLVYSPLFSRYQRTAYCYYCCYHGLPPVDIIFSCPVTITLITLAKTLIIANPGCFRWTSQAKNYSPNMKCPFDPF